MQVMLFWHFTKLLQTTSPAQTGERQCHATAFACHIETHTNGFLCSNVYVFRCDVRKALTSSLAGPAGSAGFYKGVLCTAFFFFGGIQHPLVLQMPSTF